jgi:hypothetical protein
MSIVVDDPKSPSWMGVFLLGGEESINKFLLFLLYLYVIFPISFIISIIAINYSRVRYMIPFGLHILSMKHIWYKSYHDIIYSEKWKITWKIFHLCWHLNDQSFVSFFYHSWFSSICMVCRVYLLPFVIIWNFYYILALNRHIALYFLFFVGYLKLVLDCDNFLISNFKLGTFSFHINVNHEFLVLNQFLMNVPYFLRMLLWPCSNLLH